MKIFTLLALILVFTSCDKEYNWNCQCDVDGLVNDWTINGKTEDDATTDCNNREAVFNASVSVTNASCSLIKLN